MMKPNKNPAYSFALEDPYENLLAAMIQLSLQDLYRKKPKKRHYKSVSDYLTIKNKIEKDRRDAKLFFESPYSLFTKSGLNKEYVLKHYEEKLEQSRKNKLRTSLRPHKSRKKP